MKVEFIDNRPKEVKIIVTNTKIRNGIVRSFPDDDGKTYVVPTYQMNVIGMDSKGKTNTTSFEVIRFGVEKNIETGIEPHVVGLAESQSYKLNWVDYMHGSWQVKNDWLIHKGADDQKNSHGGFRLC